MRRTPLLARVVLLSVALLSSTSCGGFGEKQQRPGIAATFPVGNSVSAGWIAQVRVTFDEPVTILNEFAVRLAAQNPVESIPCRAYADLSDPRSIFVAPIAEGHFYPNRLHECVIQEGAVINAARHYLLDEYGFYFTVGAPPAFFVTATNGNAYRLDPATGNSLATYTPPAGFLATSPVATDGRVWVWLDRIAAGDDELGTFAPGDATITVVPLSGEAGLRTLGGLAVSRDGRTVYATAIDGGTGRLRVHRVDAASVAQTASLQLVTPVAGSPATFRPTIDPRRDHLIVPYSDGAGGGFLAAVDEATFTELDAGPNPGVDAYPMPAGAGDTSFDEINDWIFMALADEPTQGLTYARPDFSSRGVERETFQGTPRPILVLPNGGYVVTGLDGYPNTSGIVRSLVEDINDGFPLPVLDDVGGGLQGSTRVRALVRDPTSTSLWVICDGGGPSAMASYEWYTQAVVQIDLDPLTLGVQALPAGAPTPVTGATYLPGASE